MTHTVAVLFARSDSIYRALPGVDVWDIHRDARSYRAFDPVITHPPCRAWGRLRHLAKPRHDERELAFFALDQVRRCGGVLEHPAASSFWSAAGLPLPSHPVQFDEFGGWTLPIHQCWFGHRAQKSTYLYICGIKPIAIPPLPFSLERPLHSVQNMSHAERERTPFELASWLVHLPRGCRSEVPVYVTRALCPTGGNPGSDLGSFGGEVLVTPHLFDTGVTKRPFEAI